MDETARDCALSAKSTLVIHGRRQDTLDFSSYLSHYHSHVLPGIQVPQLREEYNVTQTYKVDNKYFTADLDLHHVFQDASLEVPSTITNCEGFIIVVSKQIAEDATSSTENDQASFTKKSIAVDESVAVRLLVVLSPSADAQSEEQCLSMQAKEAWMNWCFDHSFEFIEVQTGNEQALQRTFNEREKDGLPRVIEALNSHMWRSMHQKSGKPVSLSASLAENANSPSYASEAASAPAIDSASVQHVGDTAAKEVKISQVNAPVFGPAVSITESGKTDANPFLSELVAASGAGGDQDNDDEAVLFKIVDEAKALRTAVMSGTLSDQERRKQAEAMALRFAAMLDLDDDSD